MNANTLSAESPLPAVAATIKSPWPAVFSMGMSVVGLIMAELLPVSLLTPMARDLGVSEGSAGQAVTATAIVALFSGLFSAALTRRIDRKRVILAFSGILILSSVLVALAPSYEILLLARLLLGVGLGGFWSMAAAIAMRLVAPAQVPKALSVIFGSAAIATAISAPLGTWMGAFIGWRGTFLIAAGLGVVALLWQLRSMPAVPPSGQTRLRTLVDVLRRPQIGRGMISVLLVFAGHFAFFTYLRPHLEAGVGAGVNAISLILLVFGLANFAGTSLAGPLLAGRLRLVLWLAPALLALIGVGLLLGGASLWATGVLIALWGLAFGGVPVAWSTWLSRSVPDEAESAGGLMVASIQLAISIGAAAGGLLFDRFGAPGAFAAGIVFLVVATLLVLSGLRPVAATEGSKVVPMH